MYTDFAIKLEDFMSYILPHPYLACTSEVRTTVVHFTWLAARISCFCTWDSCGQWQVNYHSMPSNSSATSSNSERSIADMLSSTEMNAYTSARMMSAKMNAYTRSCPVHGHWGQKNEAVNLSKCLHIIRAALTTSRYVAEQWSNLVCSPLSQWWDERGTTDIVTTSYWPSWGSKLDSDLAARFCWSTHSMHIFYRLMTTVCVECPCTWVMWRSKKGLSYPTPQPPRESGQLPNNGGG